jgi:hypothetical protein
MAVCVDHETLAQGGRASVPAFARPAVSAGDPRPEESPAARGEPRTRPGSGFTSRTSKAGRPGPWRPLRRHTTEPPGHPSILHTPLARPRHPHSPSAHQRPTEVCGEPVSSSPAFLRKREATGRIEGLRAEAASLLGGCAGRCHRTVGGGYQRSSTDAQKTHAAAQGSVVRSALQDRPNSPGEPRDVPGTTKG